ncbi:MAG: hypothetical protein OXT06_07115 [Rhodospirillaceae bacterium]|nr:hypothetical protein [Rhodospirillaceae bacterium]MDD9915530.1 hypothetical protein [Rhodospirillaceae bacterium]MDD9929136.1 hypothetical protein [Rhodospirillaceae bacterium]
MRVFVLLAALSVTAPTPAEEQAKNHRLCQSANTVPERRIIACSRSIDSGNLTRISLAQEYYARGRAQADLRHRTQAIDDFSQTIRLDPSHVNAFHDRGKAYENAGRLRSALRDYDFALARDPDFAAALNSKAWLLATAPDAAIRDGVQAVRLALRALRLVAYPEHHGTLAASYAEAGRFKEAVRTQEMAIARLQATGRVLLLTDYRSRLALYRAGQAFHRGVE